MFNIKKTYTVGNVDSTKDAILGAKLEIWTFRYIVIQMGDGQLRSICVDTEKAKLCGIQFLSAASDRFFGGK
ncbi:MAG: hypothetical protein IJF42_08075 [Clostridia bacterium]|nr:hypothetical protein [Clostridia bacterium]